MQLKINFNSHVASRIFICC